MSYQVLARKWRPNNFNEVVGQDHIVKTLSGAVKNNKIAHAYLLTGTRGIGKTTIARIFAKAIRCQNLSELGEPCLKCESCTSLNKSNSLDYIEIDGASNNSVDDIRDLIENVQYLPTTGKYKVYVIDEVHMLTVNAFNALLKTLEEPPAHVVFIFATTDPQKLLGTVLSRCQRLDFKNASIENLVSQLEKVLKSEEIYFDNKDLISVLAKQARGSYRDALSLLDQIISLSDSNKISEKTFYLSLGMAESKSINDLLAGMINKDKQKTLSIYNDVLSENIELKVFSKQILDKLYSTIVSIDESGQTQNSEDQFLFNTNLIELMWIFETMTKDIDWALNSIDPEKACGFVFTKIALREMILNNVNLPISSKKKPKIEEKIILEEPAPQKTWDEFLNQLHSKNRSLVLNLERGNLLNQQDFGLKDSTLIFQFSEDCKIFYDYLIEKEAYDSLIEEISLYTGLDKELFAIKHEVLSESQIEKDNFKSFADLDEQQKKEDKSNREQLILENKFIKEAEELFSSKVDKVVLKEDL